MMRGGTTGPSFRTAVAHAASVVFWLAAWQAASLAFAQPLLLPGPAEVARALAGAVASGPFWASVGFSTARILLGLVLAYATALPAAGLAHRVPLMRVLLNPPLQAVKATPVVCVVVLLLLWFGAANVSFAAVLLMALPGLYFTTLEGLAHQDVRLRELFDVHGVRGPCRALAYTWQQVVPYVLAASANVVGMAWKAGVAAELIGVPIGSIGERIYQAKLLIETADVLAWTIAVITISVACERAALALLRASAPAAIRLAVLLPGRGGSGARPGAEERPLPCDPSQPEIVLRDVELPFDVPVKIPDLVLAPGERRCLTAPSGQGKTTALRLVAGLTEPAAGTATAPSRRAMLFQETRLIEDASALQNILLFANWGRSYFSNTDIESMLQDLIPGIDPHAPVRALSGGQRRRVEIIRTMLAPGDIVLLDEPFSGLDPASRDSAVAFVLEHLRGRTLLIATHDPRDLDLCRA